MPLSPFEIVYQAVQSFSDPSSTKIDQMNGIQEESLSISSSVTTTFPEIVHTDEKIREFLSVDDLPGKIYITDLHFYLN